MTVIFRTRKGMCVRSWLWNRIYETSIHFYYFIFIEITFVYTRTDNESLLILKKISLLQTKWMRMNDCILLYFYDLQYRYFKTLSWPNWITFRAIVMRNFWCIQKVLIKIIVFVCNTILSFSSFFFCDSIRKFYFKYIN
jgi:hypothetical protein